MANEEELCAICLDSLTDPLLLNVCRHTFCAMCILSCYGSNAKVVPCAQKKFRLSVNPKCPVCRLPFALSPEKGSDVQFLTLKSSQAAQEATECAYCDQPLACKGQIVEHLTLHCSKAEMSCPLCAQPFQLNHFDAHLRNTCMKVPCTCCALVGPWAFIKAHNANFNVNSMNESSAEAIHGLAALFRTTAQPLDTMRVCAKLLGQAFTVSNGFEGQLPDLAAMSAWRNQLPPFQSPLLPTQPNQPHQPSRPHFQPHPPNRNPSRPRRLYRLDLL